MILIEIYCVCCISDGIKFYRSDNNVILSTGDDKSHTISTKYFKEVLDLKKRTSLMHQIVSPPVNFKSAVRALVLTLYTVPFVCCSLQFSLEVNVPCYAFLLNFNENY